LTENVRMLNEIREQPRALRETIESTLKQAEDIKQVFGGKVRRKLGSVFLIGCGTSYYAAIAGKHAIGAFAGIPSVASPASEFRDFEMRKRGNIVVAISQSGETGDVLTAVKQAIRDGCVTLAVTNEAKSTLAEICETTILTRAGKELAVPMTKTYTALLAGLFGIGVTLGQKEQVISELQKIPEIVKETIKTSEVKVRKISEELKDKERIFLLGRGPNYATALEASLKLKEVAMVHAEAFPSSEFRHGPKALVEDGTPVIALATSTEYDETTLGLIEDLKAMGAKIIRIGDRADSTIAIQPTDYYLTPIPNIIPLQLLAANIAIEKGINPDNPRSLVKTTTAT